jgi:hypothetical protein
MKAESSPSDAFGVLSGIDANNDAEVTFMSVVKDGQPLISVETDGLVLLDAHYMNVLIDDLRSAMRAAKREAQLAARGGKA